MAGSVNKPEASPTDELITATRRSDWHNDFHHEELIASRDRYRRTIAFPFES